MAEWYMALWQRMHKRHTRALFCELEESFTYTWWWSVFNDAVVVDKAHQMICEKDKQDEMLFRVFLFAKNPERARQLEDSGEIDHPLDSV